MTDAPKPPAKPQTQRDRRAEALQKALRENLRRRKAAAAPDAEPDDTATPDAPGDDHEKARENGGEGA